MIILSMCHPGRKNPLKDYSCWGKILIERSVNKSQIKPIIDDIFPLNNSDIIFSCKKNY